MATKNGNQKELLHAIMNKKKKTYNFENDFEEIKFKKIKNKKMNDDNLPNRKRSINKQPVNIFIKYLVVLDQSVLDKYKKLYQQLDDELVMQYLKIQFCQILNGVYMKTFYRLIFTVFDI